MELEVKLTARPDVPGGPEALFERLLEATSLAGFGLGPAVRHRIRDVYFDTPDRALSRGRFALRLREQDGRRLVTVKGGEKWSGAGLSRREEYEAPLDALSLTAALQRLVERQVLGRPAAAAVLLRDFAAGQRAGPLLPVLDAATDRRERPVRRQGGDRPVVLLSLDRVEYTGLGLPPFFDVELEAVSAGGEADLRALQAALVGVSDGALEPAAESKLARGLRLLK